MTPKLVRTLACLLAVMLSAAACSGSYDRIATTTTTTTTSGARPTTTTPQTSTTAPPSTTTRPPGVTTTAPTATTTTIRGSTAGLPGRLAVVHFDGSLLTMRPDGSDLKELAPSSPGTSVSSPTWSPDATRLVWTALGTNAVRVRSATPDGTEVRDATLSPPGSVYLWAGTTDALAALRATSPSTTELTLLDATTLAATPLRTGAPVFAAWSPDGKRLLVHAGTDEVVVIATDGTARTVPVQPGSFGAPQWLDDRTAVIAVRNGTTQFLSMVDVETGSRRDLVTFDQSIRFQLAPDKTKIAYQVVPETGGGGNGANVSWRPQSAPPTTTTLPQARQNELAVLELATGRVTVVRDSAANAFVWSPDSAWLALLTNDTDGAVRWRFWSPQTMIDGAVYAATRQFVTQYVPLFDQYAQSVQWWSPDGRAFVYAGRAGARTGIWIQQMQNGLAPTFVADGDSAVWSPR